MKVVFFGTPDYVIAILEALHKTFNTGREKELVAVVTQEPKAVGRDKKVTRSAVDNWAYKHKIDIIFDLDTVPQADLGVVAAYGKIIPEDIIKKFSKGLINIHPSLLPAFRGASPIQAQIATGTDQIGVTLIQMDAQMDHGPILTKFKDALSPDDTFASLRARLFARSAEVLIEMLPAYLSGKITPKEQDHEMATYTTLLKKDHGFIPWDNIKNAMENGTAEKENTYGFIKDWNYAPTATNLERLIRAMNPWPMAWTTINEKRLKILKAHVDENKLVLDEVQLEGKTPVSWEQFREGYPNIFEK